MQNIDLEFAHFENGTKGNKFDVIELNFTIDENKILDGAKNVLKVIRPSWNIDNVNFKKFTDGLTNKLIGCFNQKSNKQIINVDNNNSNTLSSDVVLIRIYGNKTEMLIDRRKEAENILILSKYNFAPKLYATFCNGLAYEFVPGNTLTAETIRLERIWKLVARKMAQMHKLNDPNISDNLEPVVYKKTVQFLNLLPEKFSNPAIDERIKSIFPPLSMLKQDFMDLYDLLKKLDSPIVFCHNDLLLGNVIYTEECNKVTFIDFEYAGFNHQAFDIGNHFTEFAGTDEIDYSQYPAKDFQFAWLREYLEEFTSGDVENEQIERLYVQVNQFALSSHYLWVIWALLQAEHSLIDFDFINFGATRYAEYLRRKEEFLSLTL